MHEENKKDEEKPINNEYYIKGVEEITNIHSKIREYLFLTKYGELKKINVLSSLYNEDWIMFNNMINTYMKYGYMVDNYREFATEIKLSKKSEYKHDIRDICFISDKMFRNIHPIKQVSLIKMILRKIKDIDNIKVILVCKNPHILYAIEIYSKLYKLENEYNVYMIGKEQEMIDVTYDTNKIYRDFSKPIQKLDNLKYELEFQEEY